jgi:hypothetical protein
MVIDDRLGARGQLNKRRRERGCVLRRCLLALSIASNGCSFVMVRGAPPRDDWPTEHLPGAEDHVHCTSSLVAPIVDGVFTLSFASATTYYATHLDGENGSAALMFMGASLAIPYFVSTIYGFVVTSRCREYLAGPPYPSPYLTLSPPLFPLPPGHPLVRIRDAGLIVTPEPKY